MKLSSAIKSLVVRPDFSRFVVDVDWRAAPVYQTRLAVAREIERVLRRAMPQKVRR